MAQQDVYKAVWPWREREQEGAQAKNPSLKRALIQVIVLMALAALLYFKFDKRIPAITLTCASTIILIGALFIPPLFFAVEKIAFWVGKAVAVGMTWLLLVPFYYICFLPGNLVLRLVKKDPMFRKFPGTEETYWTPRPAVHDLNYYKRQY